MHIVCIMHINLQGVFKNKNVCPISLLLLVDNGCVDGVFFNVVTSV